MLLLDLAQFLLGEEVDGAEALALAVDAFEPAFDVGDRRQLGARFDFSKLGGAVRLDFEPLADFVGEIGEPALGGVAAFLAAGGFGARFADRFERGACDLVGFGKLVLGGGEPVGIGAARGGGGIDLTDQRLALGSEFFRRARQFGALARGFLDALADGRDLGLGVVLALVPGLPFLGNGLQPAAGKLGFAHDRLRLDADFGERAAVRGDDVVDGGELGFEIGGHRQGGKRRRRFALAGKRFVAAGADPHAGFLERRNARRIAGDLAFGRGVFFAGVIGQALRIAPLHARLHFGCGGGGDCGLGDVERLALRRNVGAGGLELAFDRLEPAAFGEPARRAGRRVRRGGKTVPAPIVAFARHQPLAGF